MIIGEWLAVSPWSTTDKARVCITISDPSNHNAPGKLKGQEFLSDYVPSIDYIRSTVSVLTDHIYQLGRQEVHTGTGTEKGTQVSKNGVVSFLRQSL